MSDSLIENLAGYLIYASAVGIVGVLILWWLNRYIRRTEDTLLERLERLKRFDAIRTESPLEDPTGEARERGLENVTTRFSMVRRTLLPVVGLLIVVIVILPLLSGVPATFLSLLVAIVGVIAGIAAKPLIENLIAGVVISFSQPVRIGDTLLIDGHFGTVEDISTTHTTVKIWDWRRYMVPNSVMLTKEFINCSIVDRYQWAFVEFWVAPETDLERVRELALAAPKRSGKFADYEEPRFWVMEMGQSGIRCWVAAWANTPYAAWLLGHEVRTELARRFREEGIKTHLYRHELGDGTLPVGQLQEGKIKKG